MDIDDLPECYKVKNEDLKIAFELQADDLLICNCNCLFKNGEDWVKICLYITKNHLCISSENGEPLTQLRRRFITGISNDKAVTGELAIQTACHDYHFLLYLGPLSSENFNEILKQKHESVSDADLKDFIKFFWEDHRASDLPQKPKWIQRSLLIAGAGILATAGGVLAAPVVASAALGSVGFSAAGVVGGSIAAGWQASIGNVVAGSMFAACQSAGAAGISAGTAWLFGAGTGAAAAAAAGAATKDKSQQEKRPSPEK